MITEKALATDTSCRKTRKKQYAPSVLCCYRTDIKSPRHSCNNLLPVATMAGSKYNCHCTIISFLHAL